MIDSDIILQILFFSAEALIIMLLILGLFRLRSALGLFPLLVVMGVFQPIQVLLVSSIYVELLPGFFISTGSVVMFSASLFAILLVYIREDVFEARKLISGIVIANLTMTFLLFMTTLQLGFPATRNFLDLPVEMFNQGSRILLVGTISLIADLFLIIFIYEAVGKYISKTPSLRIYLTMASILIFDTLVFSTGVFYGQPIYTSIVLAGIIAKISVAVLYTGGLIIYLKYFESNDQLQLINIQPFRGVFYALTYREKYDIERKLARKIYRESESRFRAAFEHSSLGMCLTDLDGTLTRVNESFCAMLGYSLSELEGKNFNSISHPDDQEIGRDTVVKLIGGEAETAVFEKRYLTKSDTSIWVHINTALVRDQADMPMHFITQIEDITSAKRMQEALLRSEEQFSNAFHSSPTGMTITRIKDGKFIDVNDAFLRLFEFNREEAIGHTSTELRMWSPKERKRLIEKQIETGGLYNYELQAVAKSGRIINILFSSKPMKIEGEESLITTMIDITHRAEAESALRESEEKYRTLVGSSSDFIFLIDEKGVILSLNKAAARSLHKKEQEIAGQKVSDIFPKKTAEKYERSLKKVFETGKGATSENTMSTGKQILWISTSLSPVKDRAGQVTAVMGISRDITQQKKAEQA